METIMDTNRISNMDGPAEINLSIIIPIHNEEKNLTPLLNEVITVLSKEKYSYEIIAINDGSTDGTEEVLKQLAQKDEIIKIINFQFNFGQTAALSAGLREAKGEVIITMDGDGENDPKDIPFLMAEMNKGYETVSGWRKHRWKNQKLTRKIPSVLANWLISKITGLKLHDYGCMLKAYKREVIDTAKLYGEAHRFIPACLFLKREKIKEVEVNFRPRLYGKSHYGFARVYTVILDLILIKYMIKHMGRPMHFFGGFGLTIFFLGILTALVASILKIMHIRDFIMTPLPILSAILIIVGIQLTLIGLIAEMHMRSYYEIQNRHLYSVKDKINF